MTFAHAETPETKGLRIATKADAVNAGFKGEASEMVMILTNAHGDKTTRKMSSKRLRVQMTATDPLSPSYGRRMSKARRCSPGLTKLETMTSGFIFHPSKE